MAKVCAFLFDLAHDFSYENKRLLMIEICLN